MYGIIDRESDLTPARIDQIDAKDNIYALVATGAAIQAVAGVFSFPSTSFTSTRASFSVIRPSSALAGVGSRLGEAAVVLHR